MATCNDSCPQILVPCDILVLSKATPTKPTAILFQAHNHLAPDENAARNFALRGALTAATAPNSPFTVEEVDTATVHIAPFPEFTFPRF